MKKLTLSLSSLALLASSWLFAQPGSSPVAVNNSVRVQWDDNVFTTREDQQESFKFINELELILDHEQNATYYGIRYAPSFIWYDDRPGDSTDINHQLDLSLRHRFTPLTSASFRNTLRYSQEPELVDGDVTVRRRNDFLYNSFNAAGETHLVPERTVLRVNARYAVMRYDESSVADDADYDQVTFGADIAQRLAPNTEGGLQVRYTVLDYENDFRDVDALQVGANFSRIFSPVLQGDLRFGLEYRDADNAIEQTSTTPYVEGNVVLLPVANTRMTLGASYALDKSATNRFAQQERTRLFGTLSHDITPGLRFALNASYSMGNYDMDDATSFFNPETDRDGDENILQFSARLTYRIDVRHSVEASYQFTELDSDVRPNDEFERNRFTVGWKFSFL